MSIEITNVEIFIEQIIKRPALYGANKVEDIGLLVLGYSVGKRKDELNDFRVFVNKKFRTTKKDHSWERLIRFYAGSDNHSMELFKNLYQEWKEKK